MTAVTGPTSEPAAAPGAVRKRRSSGIVVPNAPRWRQRVAARLVWALVRLVTATLRYRWTDRSGYFEGGPRGPAIYCTWHNRLALSMVFYHAFVKRRGPGLGLAALVSASKDGAFLAAILECFGVQPVRGSSSRRGPQALLELTGWAERGYDVAITPDGPRGPRYVVQEGAIHLAQVTGLPIIPASFYVPWKIQPHSWDRFQIPVPFSRAEMVFGKAISVPSDASDAVRETLRQQLEQIMKEISRD